MHSALVVTILTLTLSSPATAMFLYGVTNTNLIVIDTTDPGAVRTIGAHGLAPDRVPAALAYDTDEGRLFGKVSRDLGGGTDFDFLLVEFDLATGSATEVLDLGTFLVDGTFEAFEYHEALGSLVVSIGPPGDATSVDLFTLDSGSGAMTPLVSTAIDNDWAVYDDERDIFYVWDANDVGLFQSLDLDTGTLTNLSAIGRDYRDGAFSEEDGGIFLYDLTDGSLVNADTNAGTGPVTFTSLGLVAGDQVRGLAFTPVPEPAGVAALALGAGLLLPIAHRRRVGHH